MEAHLGVHHHLLGGWQPPSSRPPAWRPAGTFRFTRPRAIGPELVVAARAAHEPDGLSPPLEQVAPLARGAVRGAVEMEQRQSAGRTAEGVHAGHRLLAAVAPLVEMHRGADPAGLVGDVVVGVQARRGSPRAMRSASKAHRPAAGPAAPAYASSFARHITRSRSTGRPAVARGGPPVTAYSPVTSVTSTRIMNRIRSSHCTSAAASPGSMWAVNASPSSTPYDRVLDVPLWTQDERRGRGPGARAPRRTGWSGSAATEPVGPLTRMTSRARGRRSRRPPRSNAAPR